MCYADSARALPDQAAAFHPNSAELVLQRW